MSDRRPAFYALAPGGWRDWWTLLHPPYTVWHLSYVAFGAVTAPALDLYRLGMTLLGFFLGLGFAAHALDELRGRPLGTAIPDRVLQVVAVVSLVGAAAVGVVGVVQVSAWLAVFIAAGVFLVAAYNLELLGGAFHSDLWFAIAWGGFPALTGAFAQDGRLTVAAVLVAGACVAISAAQRALSTPVRRLRRRVAAVDGTITLRDGTVEAIGAEAIGAAPEAALKLLSLAMPILAVGLVAASR
ncbi:MAG TPA: hypothetical protein VFZ75_04025 [Actinomycetota bacterium]|nr:hypothetical protein [Actinomycetota bacterium]